MSIIFSKTPLLFLLIVYSIKSYSQKEYNIWYFGDGAGIDFNQSEPKAIYNSQMYSGEGSAVICDVNGNLLFYTNGESIWNRNHQIMPNGNNLFGANTSTQSASFVKTPGSDSIYYLFTISPEAGEFTPFSGLSYSLINLNLDNGLGDIDTNFKNIKLVHPTSEKITTVKHKNNCFTWVITHKWKTDSFYTYLISDTGISSPVISKVGPVVSGNYSFTLGQLKASPNGSKLVFVSPRPDISLYDFNNITGEISNYHDLTDMSDEYYGVSFSPNSKKLYVASYFSSLNKIYQYNLESFNIKASRYPTASSNMNLSALQLAPDGKIYVAAHENDYLGIIENPNESKSALVYIDTGIYIGNAKVKLGLPNITESIYDQKNYFPLFTNFSFDDSCLNCSIQFKDLSEYGASNWHWDFGDGSIENISNPIHSYTDTGVFNIKLISSNVCFIDSIEKNIQIKEFINTFIIPSAFSPNQDGLNDILEVIYQGVITLKEFKITDRWGHVTYSAQTVSDLKWDGKVINGTDAENGIYLYLISAISSNGEELKQSGYFTLLR